MSTLSRQAMNAVCDTTGRGGDKYNDKLVNGKRSLKVVGWNTADYLLAMGILESQGCTVKLVTFTKSSRGGWNYTQTRLHVTEPA